MNLSVVGLGKLGSCLMAVLASNHEVIGVDLNAKIVHDINNMKSPFVEPGLQDLLLQNHDHYMATTDTFEVAKTDMTFVVVPTPSGADGAFINDHIFSAIDMIGAALQTKTTPHIVVITSTVMPGSTRGPIRDRLDHASGRGDIALAYCPEFIALGSVIEDMLHPDMLLVGSEQTWVQATIIKALDPHGLVPAARVSSMEAEIAKLAINAYVTTKISFANTIGEACDRIDADASKVMGALGLDTRIGPKYLKPATAFGGPCFPRDNQAFIAWAEVAPISQATVEINERQVHRTVNRLCHLVGMETYGVTVLGMAYKPDTPIIERSFGVELAKALVGLFSVTVYDPLAMDAVREELGATVKYADNAQEAVEMSRSVVIAQPCDEFRNLKYGNREVLDLWRIR